MFASRLRRLRLRPVVAATLLGWLVFAGVSLVLVRRDFGVGEDAVNRARMGLTPGKIKTGTAEQQLLGASRAFRQGTGRIRHPLMLPLRLLPFAGRQLRSAAALGSAAAQLTSAGAKAARQVRLVLADPPETGAARVATLERLSSISSGTEQEIRQVSLGPRDDLLAPLADVRDRLARESAELEGHLRRAAALTRGLGQLLRGPRRYLVLAGNNSEMRAGFGMFLSAGVLTAVNGELHLGEMQPTGVLGLPGTGVAVEGDQGALWGWTNPGREWRNLGMTPRFEATAPLAARMWEARTGQHVDGVFALDVVALRAVLAATGPVLVGGVQIGENTVERHLLHDQYEGLVDNQSFEAAQETRRDQLSEIAKAALDGLQGGRVDLAVLAAEMADVATGRHVLLWSNRRSEQAAWEAADISGKMASNSVLLAVLNRGGNKLDQYLRVDAEIQARRESDGGRAVAITARLKNAAPEGDPAYVAGPHPDLDVAKGTYVGLLAITVPGDAVQPSFGDGVTTNISRPDGPTRVIATLVDLERGQERTLVATFRLPGWQRELIVEPSARVPPVQWRMGSEEWDDKRRRVSLPG